MSNTTITDISYTGTVQTATVTSTYGIPVTAHIWGAGGGSSSLYPGAGGGYSRVNFVAKPGDQLLVAVGQGGGAGGVTALPPPPATVWSTRSGGYSGTTLYPTPSYAFYLTPVTATYGVWSNPGGAGYLTQVNDIWESVTFPITGYYTIQGGAVFTGPFYEPYPGTLSIDGVAVMNLPSNQAGDQQTKVWIAAGTHSISVSASGSRPRLASSVICSSVGFVISLANPSRIQNAPAGIPGASYIALLFNTRFPPVGQGQSVYAYGNGDSFLDQWGVWNSDQNEPTFLREYTITVATTGNIIFQMVASYYGRVYLDGTLVVEGAGGVNNTINQAIINVAAGTRTLRIEGDGYPSGSTNRIGVTLGNGDQTSYSGGRGGISDPTSKQGFGGGGGGATILALNSVVIGVGAGGGGGAGAAPSNITYITTTYTGSLLTNPFPNLFSPETGVVGGTIAAGTSGYYVYGRGYYTGASGYTEDNFNPSSWCVVVNGVIVYGPAATPPPVNTAQPGQFQGRSYYQPDGYPSLEYTAVQCYNFTYTAVNTGAITDARFNGQNGQDEFNFNTPDTGGGGGGGGGARGGNGGSARGSGGGGFSGHNGMSLGGTAAFPPTGRLPYTNSFYPGGNVAVGAADQTPAAGGNGAIVLEFTTGGGGAVKDGDEWKSIQTIYVNDSGVWKEVQTTFINEDGTWKPIQGGTVPTFSPINSAYGALVRPSTAGNLTYVPPPPPPAPDYSDGGSVGWCATWD